MLNDLGDEDKGDPRRGNGDVEEQRSLEIYLSHVEEASMAQDPHLVRSQLCR